MDEQRMRKEGHLEGMSEKQDENQREWCQNSQGRRKVQKEQNSQHHQWLLEVQSLNFFWEGVTYSFNTWGLIYFNEVYCNHYEKPSCLCNYSNKMDENHPLKLKIKKDEHLVFEIGHLSHLTLRWSRNALTRQIIEVS